MDIIWILIFQATASCRKQEIVGVRDCSGNLVVQCVKKGLVDGTKVFMDASLIDANASGGLLMDKNSLRKYLHKGYLELEKRLEEKEGEVNTLFISTTDPDSSIVRRTGRRAVLQYKTHRVVDAFNEVITAVEVTPGTVNEAHKMTSLLGYNRGRSSLQISLNIRQKI